MNNTLKYVLTLIAFFFFQSQVEKLTRELNLDNDALNKVSSLLLHEFNQGLGTETNADAKVKMFPTFVRDVPNGKGKQTLFLPLFRLLLDFPNLN